MKRSYSNWDVMAMLRPVVEANDQIRDWLNPQNKKLLAEMPDLLNLLDNLNTTIENFGEPVFEENTVQSED